MTHHRTVLIVLATCIATSVVTSCQSPPPKTRPITTTTQRNPNLRIPATAMFSWYDQNINAKGFSIDERKTYIALQDYLRDGFRRNGYVHTPLPPDILVSYLLLLEKPMSSSSLNKTYSLTEGSTFATPLLYPKGTLVVDLIDPQSRRLIWRGSVQAEILPDLTQKEREANLKKAVHKLISRLFLSATPKKKGGLDDRATK